MDRRLPEALYTAAQVRDLDRAVIDGLGVPGLTLMERAGNAAYRALRRNWPDARRLAVVCGTGNNGGDGFVVAHRAAQDGLAVRLLQLGDAGKIKGDARTVAERYWAVGSSEPFSPDGLADADVIVDAVFGTGLDRPVEGAYAEAIDAINAAPAPVMAVDIPSGLQGDTGRRMGVAVQAALTPTFIGLKTGLFTGDGPALTGAVVFDDLGAPAAAYEQIRPAATRVDAGMLGSVLPPRPRTAHKGRYGHVLVVGGDHGMGGALRMAAEAAGRCGAGLVSVATRERHCGPMLAARPEVMAHAVTAAADLDVPMARASVVVIGPGLGQDDWGRGLWERCLTFDGPLVVDADALNLLAAVPRRRERWVITPHPGEAGRLLELGTGDVQADRLAAAERLQTTYGGVAVLKGAGTVIRGETAAVCTDGNPGMASGGMGDVLSGVLGGLLAQGVPVEQAARAGVVLHAAAADAAAGRGERGLLATDLMPHLRRLANP
ncbi:NAD(P)H-hydrate dehydratase [Ectothiorhodospiraceae bacterium WFHF3C12]|nr:NAD(P)H-hydrate dehydratase [Ectothiorhodospiraceae bacterium WFHF3C12]